MIWCFTPYLIRDRKLVGESYDNEQTKVELACAFQTLGLPWIWQPVVPECMTELVEQVSQYQQNHDVLVFNLCDGDDLNGYPGVSLVKVLEASGVPFTGSGSAFYEISTSKLLTKEALIAAAVPTPPFAILPKSGPIEGFCQRLGSPLFVKPAISAEGWGLSLRSVAATDAEITACRDELLSGEMAQYFLHDTIFVERFIEGPEFTVFLGGYCDRPDEIWMLPPVERVFDPSIPNHERILCNERLVGSYFHDEACAPEMIEPLKEFAKRAYCAAKGSSYGRVDIREDRATGNLYALEVNANPGISADEAQVSVGRMLRLANMTFPDLLAAIIRQTISRAERP